MRTNFTQGWLTILSALTLTSVFAPTFVSAAIPSLRVAMNIHDGVKCASLRFCLGASAVLILSPALSDIMHEKSISYVASLQEKSASYLASLELGLPDFFGRVIDLGDRAQKYAETQFDQVIASNSATVAYEVRRIRTAVNDVLVGASELKTEMYAHAEVRGESLDDLSEGLERVLLGLLEELKAAFPPPDQAPSHEERKVKVSMFLSRAEDVIVRFGVERGMSEERLRARLNSLLPHVEKLVIMIGDLAEQHPVLLETILISTTLMLIPESWFLRPLLRLFGFGPAGPVKGSPAAWAQRTFFGAAVKEGSWFSHLQRAGMVLRIPEPVKKGFLGAVLAGIGFAGGLFSGCGR